MTRVRVYYYTYTGALIQIADIADVEITRENARIYFNQKQWAIVVNAAKAKGYPLDRLRYWRTLGHVDYECTLLAPNNAPKFMCQFISMKEPMKTMTLEEAEKLTGDRTEDLSELREAGALVHRAELDNKPRFHGYAGPMWDGIRADGTAILRYEDWDSYDVYSS